MITLPDRSKSFRKGALSLFLATVLALSIAGPAVAAVGDGPSINYTSDSASPAFIHEDTLTIAQHDKGEMSLSPDNIEYYNDEGNIESLPAHYNDSQDTPVSVRYDRIADEDLRQFPRVSGESENSYTWLDTANYTTASGAGSSMTVTDADGSTASGVDAVNFDASVASTETASATYERGINVSSDVDKRVLMMTFNVNELTTDAVINVKVMDSDGDYKQAQINASALASDDGIAANATGDGYVFQQRLDQLAMMGNGDGSWNEVQSIQFEVVESDADLTVTGLDMEKKSTVTLGETMADTDGDGDDESYEFSEVNGTYMSGYVDLTGLDSMASMYDDASIKDLQVHDVRYSEADRPDDNPIIDEEDDWNVTFSDATEYAYERMVDKDVRLVVPSAIDLSHGALELRMKQGLVDERYVEVNYANSTGSTTFENVSTMDATSSFTQQGEEITLDTGLNAGENVIVMSEILLKQDDEDELRDEGGAAAPAAGGDSGGIWSFVTSLPGMLISGALGLLGWSAWRRGS
jgi:hypothetical protein